MKMLVRFTTLLRLSLLIAGLLFCWFQPALQAVRAAGQSPADGIAPLFPVVEHGKWGYIDKTGRIVIPLQYHFAYRFSEGLAWVEPWPERFMLIDRTGKKADMTKIYSYALPFSEGLALVVVPGERGPGYIDATGRMIVARDDSRKDANSFREGLAPVKEGGKWGYIEKTGKMVISPQFPECGQFVEGLAAVKVGKNGATLTKPARWLSQLNTTWLMFSPKV
jgi:hypothetical protein